MDAAEPRLRAVARGRAYDLFATLFREGVTPRRLTHLRAVPALAGHLVEDVEPDEAAAEHHRLLHRELFPFESVFLDPSGLLGGERAGAVRDFMARAGYRPGLANIEPDHLSECLSLLAFLCGAEADALLDRAEEPLARVRELHREFLDAHLLRWLPPLALAVEDIGRGVYVEAMRLLVDLVAEHRAALGGEPAAWSLAPAPADLLDRERTGLRDIAAWLVVPSNVGVFLSQEHLRRLGRGLDLPQGFGRRELLVENLLHAAVQYDALPKLAEALDALLGEAATRYAVLAAAGPFPVGPWWERLGEARAVVRRIGEATSSPS